MGKLCIDTLMYDITMNCNLRCRHCYNSDFLKHGNYEKINVTKVLEGFSQIDFKNIIIQGGEPLLISNLEELIMAFNEKGINVFITTNAILLSVERSINLIKSGLKGIFFSVESAYEVVNDRIRGFGTFQLFCVNVKNFSRIYTTLCKKKLIPPMRIAFSTTVSSINFESEQSICDYFEFVIKCGINSVNFNFLMNFGAGKDLEYDQTMSNLELAKLIVIVSKKYPNINIQIPLKLLEHDFLKKLGENKIKLTGAKGKCPAGETMAYVTPDLKIVPCVWLYHLGEESSFTKENESSLYKKIPQNAFETFKKYKESCISIFHECKNCKYEENCIPICPCVARFEGNRNTSCPTRKELGNYKV